MNSAALTHDPAESSPFAGNVRFRRLRGQIAGSGRQSGACGADGVGSNQEAVERLLRGRRSSGRIARRAFPGAECAVFGKRSWAGPDLRRQRQNYENHREGAARR